MWAVAVALAVASGVIGTTAPVAGAATTRGSATDVVRDATVFNFVSGISRYSRAEAIGIARSNDLIVAHGPTFTDHLDAMKEANPDLQILIYRKGVTAWDWEGDSFPASWYLRDSSGQKITTNPWGSYVMDPRSDGWQQHTVDDCLGKLAEFGYDGCYLDVLGTGVLRLIDRTPVQYPGGPAFDEASLYPHIVELAQYVRNTISAEIPLMANSLGAGSLYFSDTAPSAALGEIIGGGHSEIWLRGDRDAADDFKAERWWREDLDMLVDASQRGSTMLVTTKLWTTATAAQIEQWREYSYASFLLGTDGSHSWAFTAEKDVIDATDHPLYKLDLGDPAGPYGASGALYTRSFERGQVIVNPHGEAHVIDLGGSFGDQHGNRSTQITVPAHSGRVLVALDIVAFDDSEVADTPRCGGRPATIVGTDGGDVLIGTNGDDVIVGLGGNDRIVGLGGDDIVCAGSGNDMVWGGSGDDEISGGSGNDLIRGATGNDTLRGDGGRDILTGQRGYDDVSGGVDRDRVHGGTGVDICRDIGNGDLRRCEYRQLR